MKTASLFCLFDSKAEVYGPPFVAESDADAMRMFGDVISRRDGLVGMHPEDYSLVRIGGFDRYSGVVVPAVPVSQVVLGVSLAARIRNAERVEAEKKAVDLSLAPAFEVAK